MIASILAALLCLPGAASAQRASTDTFVHLTSRHWLTLDPVNAFDAVSFIVTGNVYESLLTFKSVDEPDSFEPFLASRVPTVENGLLSKDGLVYRFPIRQGVRFHDGSLLTAEDVRYSILRFMLVDAEGGPAALLLKPILGVYSTRDAAGKPAVSFKDAERAVAVDKDTVVIRLKSPDSSFLKVIASLPIVTSKNWAAVHKDWDGSEASWRKFNGAPVGQGYLHDHMNGTGPFQLESIDREELVLSRHEGYWRKPSAFKRVYFRVVPNAGLRLFMLETGDADAGFLEDSLRPYAKAAKNLRVIESMPGYDLGEALFFGFKTEAAGNELLGSAKLDGMGVPADLFSDPDVRRGFAWAFDYEKYFRSALGLQGQRVSAPFPSTLVPVSRDAAYKHDPAKAEEALRKARGGKLWENGFIVPVAFSAENLARQSAAEALKSGLESLNPKFKVHLYPLSGGDFYSELEKRRLPLFVNGYYADYPDPHSYAFGLLHSRSYFPKFTGFSDSKLDALIDKAQATAAPSERKQLYLQISDLAAQDLPEIFTYAPIPLRVCGTWVDGYDSTNNVNNLNFNGFPYFYAYSKKP